MFLKPRCSEAEQSVRARISVDTLSERPDVRVRADPACVRFAREAEGRVAGRPFLGVPILWAAKNGYVKNRAFCQASMSSNVLIPLMKLLLKTDTSLWLFGLLHKSPDGVKNNTELFIVFLLQVFELAGKPGIRGEQLSQADKCPHYLDVYFNRAFAVQYA